jgi:tRNA(Ile)-lysidine synthase
MQRVTRTRLSDETLAGLLAPLSSERVVGLAVSGGPDSLGLMLLADRWRRVTASAPRFVVYAVDHALRPEAAAEAEMVARVAAGLGLAARVLRWQGPKPEAGLQSAARAARYRLMAEAMAADGAGVLVTAHHRTDQAETVLMRLAHGSGLDGLAGMAHFERMFGITVFRPLLDTDREQLMAEVEAAGLTPARDPSNADPAYERVRWRQALPALAGLGLDAVALAAFASRAGEAAEALELWADRAAGDLVRRHPLGALSLDRDGLSALPQAVAVRVLAGALQRAGGGRRPHALGVVERAADRLRRGGDRGITLLGCLVRPRARTIWICRESRGATARPVRLAPGSGLVFDARFAIRNRSPDTAFAVAPALTLTRHQAERVLGTRLDLPAAAIRSAPLVLSESGAVAALGEHALDARVEVREA